MDMLFISGQPAGMTNQQSIQGNIRAWKLRPEGPQFLYDFKATTADLSCESITIDPTGKFMTA